MEFEEEVLQIARTMKVSNLSPTLKHRRKFERIEMANTGDHDTSSSVNHNSDLYRISKLCACINQKAQQTLTDCCKESTDKCYLQEKKDLNDPIDVSRLDHYWTFLFFISLLYIDPIFASAVFFFFLFCFVFQINSIQLIN